jgi:transcription antitermination factor NusG
MVNAAQPLTIHSYLREGERVGVARGRLAGCVGILDRVNARRGRLIVNVDVFGKSVSIELDIGDVDATPGSSL